MAIYEITAPNGQTLEIEGDTPPSEADLDEIFKTTKTTAPKKEIKKPTRPRGLSGYFDKDYNDKMFNYQNEKIKEQAQNWIDKRQEWEQNHPFISSIQKDYQPGYRSQLADAQLRADYGLRQPIKDIMTTQAGNLGREAIPGANITAATLTGGESFLPSLASKGFLGQLGRGAAQGAIQGGILSGTHELGENGLNLNVIPETLKGATLGGTIGGALPVIGQSTKLLPMTGGFLSRTIGRLQPETIQQAIKPNSQALDLSAKQAQNLLTRTTDGVRNAYNDLLKQKGEAISTAEDNLRNLTDRVNISDIKNDITDVFNQYQGDKINAARNLTGNLENDLNNLVESGTEPLEDMYNYINQSQKPDFYSKAKENEAYDILSKAINKPINWLKSQLKASTQGKGVVQRNEAIEKMLDKVDDNLDLAKYGNQNDYNFYNNANLGYNNIDNVNAGAELARQAYDDIINNRFTNITQDPLSRAIAGAEQDYRFLLRDILENPSDKDLVAKNFDKLTQSVKYLPEEVQNEYFNKFLSDSEKIYQGKNTISPIDLQKVKQQIGQMTNWADTTRPKIQNTVLEQVYGKINNRLQNLSPELAQANREFANIKSFQDDEGLKRILKPGDNVDSAASALKNYDATVTKGNQYRNIKELEDTLVNAGNEPFLNTIDDINAAMDLNNLRTTGDSWLANVGTALTKPGLRLARAYNRTPLPRVMYGIKNAGRRLAIPFMYNAPRLFGEVEENDF